MGQWYGEQDCIEKSAGRARLGASTPVFAGDFSPPGLLEDVAPDQIADLFEEARVVEAFGVVQGGVVQKAPQHLDRLLGPCLFRLLFHGHRASSLARSGA